MESDIIIAMRSPRKRVLRLRFRFVIIAHIILKRISWTIKTIELISDDWISMDDSNYKD